jgi:LPS export ABC transporter protein LptC
MKRIKNLLMIGILCVVAFWVGLYAFRTQKPAITPSQKPVSGQVPGNVGLKEINFSQVKDGVKLWELKAEEVEYQKDRNLVSFKKVTILYFPKEDKPLSLVGNRGQLNTQSKDIYIEGEVVIASEAGYELKAPALHYEDEKREVWTDGQVTFKGPQILMEGHGATMKLDSQKLFIKRKAKTTFYQDFFRVGGDQPRG